jgi:catechol 2,3-dioxygenase-like lactoylglutathione lyase family enzyme
MSERLPVSGFDHVTLRVPDPRATAAYYARVLGLGITRDDRATGAIVMSTLPTGAPMVAHHELVLYPGESTRLDHYGLTVPDASALAAAAVELRRRGLSIDGPAVFEPLHGPAVRLQDPDGYLCELVASQAPVARPAGTPPANLIKLSHINVKAADAGASAQWWQQFMDFRLSDQIPGQFSWVRCTSEHATIALVQSATKGVHHIGFEIESWDDVLRMLNHFEAHGVSVEFGPGRHGPGHSIFVYFVDPWGIRWELQAEAAHIPDEQTYRPGVWDPVSGRSAAVNLWGPKPPESFIRG